MMPHFRLTWEIYRLETFKPCLFQHIRLDLLIGRVILEPGHIHVLQRELHTHFLGVDFALGKQDRINYNYVAKQIELAFENINALAKPFPTEKRSVIDEIYSRYKSEDTIFNFINFNYTDTLDKCIAQIKKNQAVLGQHRYGQRTHNHRIGITQHVHGTIDSQMVFGVNDESQIAKPDIFECDYGDSDLSN